MKYSKEFKEEALKLSDEIGLKTDGLPSKDGIDGEPGVNGTAGKSAYIIAVEHGFT